MSETKRVTKETRDPSDCHICGMPRPCKCPRGGGGSESTQEEASKSDKVDSKELLFDSLTVAGIGESTQSEVETFDIQDPESNSFQKIMSRLDGMDMSTQAAVVQSKTAATPSEHKQDDRASLLAMVSGQAGAIWQPVATEYPRVSVSDSHLASIDPDMVEGMDQSQGHVASLGK